jgi:hypothetical protein
VALRWEQIAAADLGSHPDLLDELIHRRRDGVTITGIFEPDEIQQAIARLDDTRDVRTASTIGTVLGMPIGEVGAESQDRTAFLDDTDRARALYREAFGVDPHARLAERLAPASGGRPLVPPSEGGREYNPGQMRWFEPGCGGLRAHAGNEFRAILEHGAMSHLVTTTQVTHHLSYFVVLQRPEEGGSLSVYDLLWESYSGDPDAWSSGARADDWFDDQPRLKVDPDPGSLVLFGGGWRWHRVEPVHGDRPRITYGGFAAPSVDETEIHFWT